MSLPEDLEARCVRLMQFKDDINRLANDIRDNYPKEVERGGEAVDIAIRIMKEQKEKLNYA